MHIEVLNLSSGVSWPVTSAILHCCYDNLYPVLDSRALWSIGVEKPAVYDFFFWQTYNTFCRELAERTGMSMRQLDRALWQYSKEHQPRTGRTA